MKNIILVLSLSLILSISVLAGITPDMGYAGCPGGAWYPDSQICCMPNHECPLGRSANVPSATTKDSFLAEFLMMLKNIYF